MSSDQSERPDAPLGPVTPDPPPADPPLDASRHDRSGLPGPRSDPSAERPDGPAVPLLIYSLLRVGLIVVLTALLALFMPLIVALLFAIIVQLPLSWLLFAGPRRRVNEAMAASSAHRRAERERLRAALAGSDAPPDRPAG